MNERRASTTAEGLALVRAIESERPEAVRICYDPIARKLINPISFRISGWVINSGLYARMSKGALEFILARDRYVDDYLTECLKSGLDQVVILGAGFDTRPYRLPGNEKPRVFEVDHPATQALKMQRMKKIFDPLPAHITYVPLDFNTQSLEERLLACGYNSQAKTLFIWQGVSMYLSEEGVDATLAFVAHHSGHGSSLIFDYLYNEARENAAHNEMKNARRILKATNEQWTFGIDPDKLEPFLAQRGFKDIRSISPEDLTRLYFTGPNAGRVVGEGVAIATAVVDPEHQV